MLAGHQVDLSKATVTPIHLSRPRASDCIHRGILNLYIIRTVRGIKLYRQYLEEAHVVMMSALNVMIRIAFAS